MQLELFPKKKKYKILSLSSGSSGNCYYVGCSEHGILIDAGIGVRTIKKYLRDYGVALETIMGVLVTHDHGDHIKSVSVLSEKMHIPVYTTESIHKGIDRSKFCKEKLNGSSRKIITKRDPFSIKDFQITAFEVPHDSIENVGYQIKVNEQTIVIATDIGRITDEITHYAATANHLIFESNYDEFMLRTGSYPDILKRRIISGNGHLSNSIAGEFLAKIFHSKMDEIWLCHLSNDNNHPELAYKTVMGKLIENGIKVGQDVVLKTLLRGKPSAFKEF